jgi:hypothetical protein
MSLREQKLISKLSKELISIDRLGAAYEMETVLSEVRESTDFSLYMTDCVYAP